MGWTIRISQKHVERFIFMIIILLLIGILIADKLNLTLFNINFGEDFVTTTTVLTTSTSALDSTTTTTAKKVNASTTSSTRFGTTTTSLSSSTTTTLQQNTGNGLEFTVDKVYYHSIDTEKGVIDSIDVSIKNNMGADTELVLKYYIYDETSSVAERTTPNRPFIEVGILKNGAAISDTYTVNRTIFNIEYVKTLKFELEDSASGKKWLAPLQKITIN